MTSEERLAKIRSVIREAEEAFNRVDCDQLVALRSAFLDIILAAGPQPSGRKRVCNDQANCSERVVQDLCGGNSDSVRGTSSGGKSGHQRRNRVSGRTLCTENVGDASEPSRRTNRRYKRAKPKIDQNGISARGITVGEDSGRAGSVAEAVRSFTSREDVFNDDEVEGRQSNDDEVEGRQLGGTETCQGCGTTDKGLHATAADFEESTSSSVVTTTSQPIED